MGSANLFIATDISYDSPKSTSKQTCFIPQNFLLRKALWVKSGMLDGFVEVRLTQRRLAGTYPTKITKKVALNVHIPGVW